MMRTRIWLLLFLLLCSVGVSVFADGEEQEIDITAEKVEYDQNTRMAYAEGKVVIVKGDVRLVADKARYNQENQDMFADGNVRLTSGDREWIGDSLFYNFQTRALHLDVSRAKAGEIYVQSQSVRESGTNAYASAQGYLTTCDYPEPHYRLTYRRLVIYPDDRIVGYHAVLKAGPVPLFYWPYFQKKVGDDHMPLSLRPGVSSRYGAYLLMAYEWGVSKEVTLTPRLDIRERRGIGGGLQMDYDAGEWAQGTFRGYYASDPDPRDKKDTLFNKATPSAAVDTEDFDTNRYRLDWAHKTSPLDTVEVMLKADYLSDPDVVEDYFRGEYRKEIQPDTFADVTYTGESFTAGMLARPNVNEFFTKTERLPEASWSFVRTPLGASGVFYEGDNTVGYLNREFADTYTAALPRPKDYNTIRGDSFHQVVYPKLFFGWLSIVPRAGGRVTYYSRTATPGTDDTVRGVFNTGAEASFKLSHVYDTGSERFDIHGLRHVITPSLNHAYVTITRNDDPRNLFPFDTIDAFDPLATATPPLKRYSRRTETTRFNPVDFPAYNAVDAIDYENVFRVGLRNQLQTKREGKPYDLVDLFVFSDLHVDPRKDQDTELFGDLEIRPVKWMAIDTEARWSFDREDLLDLNAEVRLLQQDRWSFGIGQRYLRNDNHQIAADFRYALNENWAFAVIERFDIDRGKLDEQEYTIYRDLHCWALALTVNYRSEEVGADEFEVRLVMTLKAFPRLYLPVGN